MPDTGFNSYLSIAPDGTVVVPNNIDVAGVVTAGDLATHADLDAAVAGLADTSYVDAGDTSLQDNIDALSADVVHGAGLGVSRQYDVALSAAGGDLTTVEASVDVFEIDDLGWTEWAVVGFPYMASGNVQLGASHLVAPITLVLEFVSLSSGVQDIEGDFFFYVIGRP